MQDLILDQSSPRSFPFDYPVTTRVKMVKEVQSIASYHITRMRSNILSTHGNLSISLKKYKKVALTRKEETTWQSVSIKVSQISYKRDSEYSPKTDAEEEEPVKTN